MVLALKTEYDDIANNTRWKLEMLPSGVGGITLARRGGIHGNMSSQDRWNGVGTGGVRIRRIANVLFLGDTVSNRVVGTGNERVLLSALTFHRT